MRPPLYALVLALAGCVTTKPVALPDGAKGFSIDCSGVQHDDADCMNQAAALCRGPYQIIAEDRQSLMLNPNKRTMIVSCGP